MNETPDDDELFARAVTAYRRHCERHGYVFAQPSSGGEIDGDTITLSNMHGTLARYRWNGARLEMCELEE